MPTHWLGQLGESVACVKNAQSHREVAGHLKKTDVCPRADTGGSGTCGYIVRAGSSSFKGPFLVHYPLSLRLHSDSQRFRWPVYEGGKNRSLDCP